MLQQNNKTVFVSSEVGSLKRLLVHSPDSGLGKVVPSKAQDWLFEDIVHLENMRREEYDFYIKILLYFLDKEKIKGKIRSIDDPASFRAFYKPDHPGFHQSDKVIEFQYLLGEILKTESTRIKLIAAICAVEGCPMETEKYLLKSDPHQLAKTLISGTSQDGRMIFAPLPNLIFTRDIGIIIKDHILLNKPAKIARTREALLTKYIFYNHPFFKTYHDQIIEIPNSEHHFLLPDREKDNKIVTLEGGDVMMVSDQHLLIGCSERTSSYAANQLTKILFEKNIVSKVTVIKIPRKRDYMHIDTIFTQVKKNTWVLLGSLSKHGEELEKQDIMESLLDTRIIDQLKIIQFIKGKEEHPVYFDYLEDLLDDISQHDLKCDAPTRFIYSGNNEFPYGDREQWTDSCNVLAIKEGVVIGYDRNTKTAEAFQQEGFSVKKAAALIEEFESNQSSPEAITGTLILLPSAELSRARGGSHCMSMPLMREDI
jgi:arginine deiminase